MIVAGGWRLAVLRKPRSTPEIGIILIWNMLFLEVSFYVTQFPIIVKAVPNCFRLDSFPLTPTNN